MSVILERSFWLILVLALIPLWLHWRKGLTRQSKLRAFSILTLRCAWFILLVLALIGPVVTWKNFSKFVVCAVDLSSSVTEGNISEQLPDAEKVLDGDQCIVLPFAEHPGRLRSLETAFFDSNFACGSSALTNLSSALGAAAALAPEDFVPEVILYSDGISNLGPMPQNAGESVPIHFVQLPSPFAADSDLPETWIERFSAPVSAYEGEVAGMDLFVHATHALGELKIDLYRNGELAESQMLVFEKPGVRGVRFQVSVTPRSSDSGSSEKSPLTEWKAVIHPAKEFDSSPQNNEIAAVTRIVPHEKILLVERSENLGELLRGVLKKEFIEVETCLPEEMPVSVEALQAYGLVILSNIPAPRIPEGALSALETYVSVHGGGLLVAGGDQAFTSGGYRGTPMEKLLPVFCLENKNRPREGLALALVVDRSGSMQGEAIALAREAVKGAMNVLGEQDQAGVHIYADTSGWVVPFCRMTEKNRANAFRAIDQITAISGTNMDLALEKAARALADVSAERKHIIVMTDGISIPANFMATAQKIRDAGITLSTIALGAEAEPNLLADIAQVGNGNAYVCLDPVSMPEIFAVETASAAKIGVVEGRTPVKQLSSIPGFLNFDFTKVPPLLGYVQTAAKPESRVIFASGSKDRTQTGDPILAWWRFGRGKVVAFTSDMESPHWLQTWRGGWPDFDRFWGRLVAHTIRKNETNDFRIQTACRGDWLSVSLTLPNDRTLDRTPELKIDGSSPVPLLPVAPGVYGTRTKIIPGRKYDLLLTASVNGQTQTWAATTVQTFTDEFLPDPRFDMTDRMKEIAQETGGTLDPVPASLFPAGRSDENARFVLQTLPVWRFFLLLALLLWMAELGLRRAKS